MPASRKRTWRGRDRTEKRRRAALRRALRKTQTIRETAMIAAGQTIVTAAAQKG